MHFRDLFAASKRVSDLETSPYTDDLVKLLAERFGIQPGEQGAYLGAASTRLATLFLEHGHKLAATAATAEGRHELEALQRRWPEFQVVDGTPERTNLPSGSIDFILSERVLYLPDLQAVRAEFRRVLQPGGVVIAITDNRVYGGSAQQEAYEKLLRTHCADFQEKIAPSGLSARVANFFSGTDVFEDAFVGQHSLTLKALIEQTSCMPIAPKTADPRHAPMVEALEIYFEQWSRDGYLNVPVVCRVACGRLAAPAGIGCSTESSAVGEATSAR